MKVLFINTSDNSGGAARAAMRIRNGVESQGVQTQMMVKNKQTCDVGVIQLDDYLPSTIMYRLFDWIAKKVKNQYQHYKWRNYKNKDNVYLSDMRSTRIHGALQKLDYDIIHLHWINQRFLDINELKRVNKPIVWTLHDSWAFCGICHYFLECDKYKTHCSNCPFLKSSQKKDIAYEVFEKKIKAYRDLNLHIVTPSRWLADCARDSVLFKRFPISVIPNCLDTEVFSPRSKDEALARWLPLYKNSFCGNLVLYGAVDAATNRIKGFSILLSALQIIENQYGCDSFELLVFGADKPIDTLTTSFKTHYLGHINNDKDLSLLYSLADVMVVPSIAEVFGQTASESLACGTPVVAFKCTGIQDVVDDSCGYLAKPYSSKDLANGIIWCIENNKDGHLGKNARRKVVENFSVDVVSQQYKRLYESLITEWKSLR